MHLHYMRIPLYQCNNKRNPNDRSNDNTDNSTVVIIDYWNSFCVFMSGSFNFVRVISQLRKLLELLLCLCLCK